MSALLAALYWIEVGEFAAIMVLGPAALYWFGYVAIPAHFAAMDADWEAFDAIEAARRSSSSEIVR